MSDDKMRAEFEAWADKQCMSLTRINWKCGTVSEYAYTATFDAWQVWQAAYAAGQGAEREAICIQWEGADATIAEVERLRAELAEAKAASVCPVKVSNIWEGTYESDRYIELRTDAEADTFTDWLRERMKDKSPPQA